eukprot:scaffold116117_cov52-Attheya_sp.AAC.4
MNYFGKGRPEAELSHRGLLLSPAGRSARENGEREREEERGPLLTIHYTINASSLCSNRIIKAGAQLPFPSWLLIFYTMKETVTLL